jgi:broad specificity phosphatase PhoE
MAILRLVRHGEPAAAWGEDGEPDPGLSPRGEAQARAVASRLEGFGPALLVSSPLARCRETARPLAALWRAGARIEPAVAEIPVWGPDRDRRAWLQSVLGQRWSLQEARLIGWRDAVAAALLALREDAVVFTHFVAINVAVGAATGSDLATVFHPGHASVTTLEARDGRLHLLELGEQGAIALV